VPGFFSAVDLISIFPNPFFPASLSSFSPDLNFLSVRPVVLVVVLLVFRLFRVRLHDTVPRCGFFPCPKLPLFFIYHGLLSPLLSINSKTSLVPFTFPGLPPPPIRCFVGPTVQYAAVPLFFSPLCHRGGELEKWPIFFVHDSPQSFGRVILPLFSSPHFLFPGKPRISPPLVNLSNTVIPSIP